MHPYMSYVLIAERRRELERQAARGWLRHSVARCRRARAARAR